MIVERRQNIADLEKEIELKNETIAVNDMLHNDFKERIKDKYLYSSNDELSDYISDEDRRELGRQQFWKNKLEARQSMKSVATKNCVQPTCKKCGFISKCESGLKIHIKKKH